MSEDQQIEWCKQQHRNTNHLYDNYLPYEFHLNMVANVANRFLNLPPNQWSDLVIACYGHDLIEDTRNTYNDVKESLGEYVADIIYAVTNEKGKNRKQRANDKYYNDILDTPGATFVKLCDRIANIEYSKMTHSKMFEMYKKENNDFMMLMNGFDKSDTYYPMFVHLVNILKP